MEEKFKDIFQIMYIKTCSCCILLKLCISRQYKKKRHKYINCIDQLSHYKEIWQE